MLCFTMGGILFSWRVPSGGGGALWSCGAGKDQSPDLIQAGADAEFPNGVPGQGVPFMICQVGVESCRWGVGTCIAAGVRRKVRGL